MGLSHWTPKITALVIIGCAITIFIIKSIVAAWGHNFRPAVWYLVGAAVLSAIFFRRRKIALTTIVLSFLLVNAGLTALFHPTAAGLLITLGSSIGLYVLAVWGTRRYPELQGKDWKVLFDRDPEL